MRQNSQFNTYIYPIISDGVEVGQCFIADNFLITAAHIVKEYPSCAIWDGCQKTELSKYKPMTVFIGRGNVDNDANELDVAVYYVDISGCPLHLSKYVPERTDNPNSCCNNLVEDNSKPYPKMVFSTEKAYPLGEEEGNYFYCYCKRHHGSSGSPLLLGDEVIGIMHGGDDNGLCAYLKVGKLLENICLDEICLAYCPKDSSACEGESALWQPGVKIIHKKGKLGVVKDEDGCREVIVPAQYDTWFTYDGFEIGIGIDFFESYLHYIGYFGIKNKDNTYTFHSYNKDGVIETSFTCDSFDKDTITIGGKKYIGRNTNGEGYDDVVRMGYCYGNNGNDNCYFALRKGNKWSLKTSDLSETLIDYIECDGFKEIGWGPKGYFAIMKKGDKYRVCIGKEKGFPFVLAGEYDQIQMNYSMQLFSTHMEGMCFELREDRKWAVCSYDLLQLSPFIFDKIGNVNDWESVTVYKNVGNKEVKLTYNLGGVNVWNIKGIRTFKSEEKAIVKRAEVVPSKNGNSVCFFMTSGSTTYIPLHEDSSLTPGDCVDLDTALLVTLSRQGDGEVFRVLV